MNKLFFILLVIFFSSCTVQHYFSAITGSNANGTITMTTEYGAFEKPVFHVDEAKQEAIRRCQNWGYSGADFFAPTSECISVNGYGSCIRWRIYLQAQCTK